MQDTLIGGGRACAARRDWPRPRGRARTGMLRRLLRAGHGAGRDAFLPEQEAQCRGDAVALWLAGLHKFDEESVGVADTDHTGGVKGREGFGKRLDPVALQLLDGLFNVLDEKGEPVHAR